MCGLEVEGVKDLPTHCQKAPRFWWEQSLQGIEFEDVSVGIGRTNDNIRVSSLGQAISDIGWSIPPEWRGTVARSLLLEDSVVIEFRKQTWQNLHFAFLNKPILSRGIICKARIGRGSERRVRTDLDHFLQNCG